MHLAIHLAAALLILAILLVARAAFLLAYADAALLSHSAGSWLWGLRLDLRVAAIATAPSLLMGLWFPLRWRIAWLSFLGLLTSLIAITNHYYFRNFQVPIDAQFFSFFADPESFSPIISTIIEEYPWFWGIVGSLLIAAGCYQLISAVARQAHHLRWGGGKSASIGVLALIVWFVAARGALGTFPLTPNRIPSQGAPVLDAATVNGPIALATAYSDFRRNAELPTISEEEAQHAWQTLFGTPPPKDILASLIHPSTPHSEQKRLPHIVVVQMESMGAAVLALDGVGGNDLLGRLRRWWKRAFVWQHAISAGLGTHITLERLIASAFVPHISRGAFRRIPLLGAYPEALRKAGYHTVFITGGVKGWSHFDEFLPAQGFDEVHGRADIEKAIPGAKDDGTWGLYDEYLFRYALLRLKTAKGPTFLYLMTTTNHSPYHLPPKAKVPMHIPDSWRPRMIDPALAPTALAAYRYAADQLGAFLDGLQQSGLLAHTLVAATGDHYMRDAMNYRRAAKDAARSYFVPLLFWLPPDVRKGVDYDPMRPASHLDLMPTLLARLPIPVQAFQAGIDLLDARTKHHPLAFALGENFAMNRCGCVLGRSYWRWRDRMGSDVVAAKPDDACLKTLARKKAARELLLRWATAERIRRALARQDQAK